MATCKHYPRRSQKKLNDLRRGPDGYQSMSDAELDLKAHQALNRLLDIAWRLHLISDAELEAVREWFARKGIRRYDAHRI